MRPCRCLGTIIILLSIVHSSTATFNPVHHPAQAYYHPSHDSYPDDDHGADGYHRQNQLWDEAESLRGGSTMTIPESQLHEEEQPFHPPKIFLKHMSMALRLTCELNRRLLDGVNFTFRFFGKKNRIRDGDDGAPIPEPSLQRQQQLQPYGSSPVNIHPDRTWNPPIREGGPDLERESLTIFHALEPRDEEASADDLSAVAAPRGVARWGPELLPYLEAATSLLQIDGNGLEIALAMIYLDRACSVDSPRSNECPPCPFCAPRTVHRLSLVALILAKQAVDGDVGGRETLSNRLQALEPLGIPLDQLESMVHWMLNALGDTGSFVTVGQMKAWSNKWEAVFHPEQHQAKIEEQKKREEQRLLSLQQQQYHQGYEHHQVYERQFYQPPQAPQ